MRVSGRLGRLDSSLRIQPNRVLSLGLTHALLALGIVVPAALAATAEASAPSGADVVPCSVAIAQSERPSGVTGLQLVLGRIWLPRRPLQLGQRARPGWDRFAKVGIVVRAGAPVVLQVPPRWRGTYALTYAARVARTVHSGSVRLSVHACSGPLGRWSAYAGGYLVERPVCVPLLVRARGRTARVRVAIGKRCPARALGP